MKKSSCRMLFFFGIWSIPLAGFSQDEELQFLADTILDLLVLGKEALIESKTFGSFQIDPSAPMPVPFMRGMLPPNGMAYAVLCMEGGGLGTVFLQRDVKGTFGHAWFEAHYSDGTIEAVSHNPGGASLKGINDIGPKIVRMAYLLPENEVKVAYQLAENHASNHPYSIQNENCLNTVEIAADFLKIPLPPHQTPTHMVASPEWLYQQFIRSPYYAPFANRESKLLEALEFYKEVSTKWIFEEPFDSSIWQEMPLFMPILRSDEKLPLFPSQIDQPRFGGIALNKIADLKIRSSDISGAVFEPLMGQLILIGEKKILLPEMALDDLAVAFKSIYGLGGPSADPAVSIEPDGSQMKVIYFGHTFGTKFGLNLFKADQTLKGLVQGFLKCRVPKYMSLTQMLQKHHIYDAHSTYRTWIVPEKINLRESINKDSMVFESVKMKCMTKTISKLGQNCHQKFADHFTKNYDLFANEYPIFQEIKRMAQITGVVKWLKENNIPIDLSFFDSYSCIPYNTPLNIDKIESPYAWQSGNQIFLSKLSGGINLEIAFAKKAEGIQQSKDEILSFKTDESSMCWDLPDGKLAETCLVCKTKKAGNFHLDFLDIFYPTATLSFSRSYDSFNTEDFGMGIGWTFVPAFLEIPKERVLAVEIMQQVPPFVLLKTRKEDQLFVPKKYFGNGRLIYLSENQVNSFLIYQENRWEYHLGNEMKSFNEKGLLVKDSRFDKWDVSYFYKDEKLITISSLDYSIELFYENGRIVKVIGSDGQSIVYQYNQLGELKKAGDDMAYEYDENHRLCSFSNPEDFLIFQGHYDDFNRIKMEKWGPIETSNVYLLEKQEIERRVNINLDRLHEILNYRKTYGY